MKPEKPKKPKSPAKRALKSVKEKLTSLFKRKPAIAKAAPPVASAKAAPRKKPVPPKTASGPLKVRSTVLPAKKAAAPPTAPIKPPKKKAPARTSQAADPVRKVEFPSILMEGDAPPAPRASGPGERYVLGTTEPAAPGGEESDLPEAYGTKRLLLVARDPHWLYAHWDLTHEQLRQYNKASRDGHLIVRVFRDQTSGRPVLEQHVHPESRNWFLHVGSGGRKFVAQLGYHDRAGQWQTVSTSAATLTPPDALSEDTSVRFETIPVEVPFQKLLALVKDAVAEHRPLVEVVEELRAAGYPELPRLAPVRHGAAPALWTPEQEAALAQIISIDEVRRVWMGSLEITELLRRSLEKEISSQAAALLAGASGPGGPFSVSSPFGGESRQRGFWFNINAELILYGATEPDAAVTVGGRRIALRPDGTFSFRFALPDGRYELPVQATSADGADSRRAELAFSRLTHHRGEVGTHPQDPQLKLPRAENVE